MAHAAGLSIEDFWNNTPREVILFVDGYRQRIEHQQEIAAWHVCNIMNMWRKKGSPPMTPKKLLRKRSELRPSSFDSPEEFMEAMEDAIREQEVINA